LRIRGAGGSVRKRSKTYNFVARERIAGFSSSPATAQLLGSAHHESATA
jgi:hypothetical protein